MIFNFLVHTTALKLNARSLNGSEYVNHTNCQNNQIVIRSNQWTWGTEDFYNGNSSYGRIIECLGNLWARVKWQNGNEGKFRIGKNESFDLYLAKGISSLILR